MTTTRITSKQTNRRHSTKTTGTYTLDSTYDIVKCNCSGGAITLNLPAAANSDGFSYEIIKTDSSVNTITIDGNLAETINGAETQIIEAQYTSIAISCDGTGWNII